ncbi:MAG: polysaccharide pyruvyl transferase family protein [Anaerolineales bacterium]
MTRILIAGYYGFGNLGDEAILSCSLRDLRVSFPDASISVLSGDPPGTSRQHGVPSLSWTEPEAILDAIHSSEVVLLGGGGLFHDYWSVAPEQVGAFQGIGQDAYAGIPILANMLGKPCMLYGVGLGPLEERKARALAAAALQRCHVLSVRDEESADLARALLGGVAQDIVVTADPAFGLQAPRISSSEQGPHRLGVCLRPWKLGPSIEWEREVARALSDFLSEVGGEIVFLPFEIRGESDGEDDAAVARRVMEQLGPSAPVRILEAPLSIDRALNEISECNLVLGMRYHSVLFSLLCGRRVAALAYDPKVSHLMSGAGFAEWALDGSDWNTAAVARLLHAAREQPRAPAEFLTRMADRARENARLAAGLIHGPLPEASASDRMAQRVALRYFGERERTQDLVRQLDTMRDQAHRLLQDRNRLARDLADLRETLGVRALDLYWTQIRRVFPEGGLGRRIYRRASSAGRRALEGLGVAMPVTDRQTRESQLELSSFLASSDSHVQEARVEPTGDVHLDLARFEQRVAQTGAGHVVAIFSSTKLVESEGQRPTHLALELAARGIPVVFVYWRWSKSESMAQASLAGGILQVPIDVVVDDPAGLFGRFPGARRTVVFEFPHPSFFESLAVAHARGWETVYDVIDDWQAFSEAGWAKWYDRGMEAHFAWSADAVLCVNSILAEKMAALGRSTTDLLPNGSPEHIGVIETPIALDRGDVTIGYFGHLSEGWFDWKLLIATAHARPEWLFYVIGYGEGRRSRRLPANVHLLGRKPQHSLAAYAANWDVAIVPFKPGPLSAAADPIKTYEYLAMGLPVVMTGCYPPGRAADLVQRAEGKTQFIDMIAAAARDKTRGAADRRQFAMTSTWSQRATSLQRVLEEQTQRLAGKHRLFARAI